MTPELVAAVANRYIELVAEMIGDREMAALAELCRRHPPLSSPVDHYTASHPLLRSAIRIITGIAPTGGMDTDEVVGLVFAADRLAIACRFVRPFQVTVTAPDGTQTVERHTITWFAEGELYDRADLFGIHALEPGASWVKGFGHIVTRME